MKILHFVGIFDLERLCFRDECGRLIRSPPYHIRTFKITGLGESDKFPKFSERVNRCLDEGNLTKKKTPNACKAPN
jgi:hypothetical protein